MTFISYLPPTDYLGNDNFAYTISDGRGGFAQGTVLVIRGK